MSQQLEDSESGGRASPESRPDSEAVVDSEAVGDFPGECEPQTVALSEMKCGEFWEPPIRVGRWGLSDEELQREIEGLERLMGQLPPRPSADELQIRLRLWRDYREAAVRARRRRIEALVGELPHDDRSACELESTLWLKSIGYGRSILIHFSEGEWKYSKLGFVRFVVAYDAYLVDESELALQLLSSAPHVPTAAQLLPHRDLLEALARWESEPQQVEQDLFAMNWPHPSNQWSDSQLGTLPIARCFAAGFAERRGDEAQALAAWFEVNAFYSSNAERLARLPYMEQLKRLARQQVARLKFALATD